jgi:cell wall-associated NlpC family hydrolase
MAVAKIKCGFLMLLGLVLALPSHAQTDQRLEKLLRKKKFDKVIAQSEKRIQQQPAEAAGHYYLLSALLEKGNRAKGLACEAPYQQAFERYAQSADLFNGTPYSSTLKKKFHAAGVRLSGYYRGKADSLARYYVAFLAQHFHDTTALYRAYFPKAATPAVVSVKESVISAEKIWIQQGNFKYALPPQLPATDLLVRKSEEVMGTPWKMGGLEPHKAFDCSGFVIWVYHQFGFELPHNTKLLAQISEPVPLAEARPGDWACFGSREYQPGRVYHIGMVHSRQGAEVRMIHCGTSTGVAVADLTSGYWSELEYFVVRLKGLQP